MIKISKHQVYLIKYKWGDMFKEQGLRLQQGGVVRHEGRRVLEVDPIGQVPLLLLLFPPPGNQNIFLNAGKRLTKFWDAVPIIVNKIQQYWNEMIHFHLL